jgi:sigma-54 specific flagellar transcriptional regulator A
MIQVPPLRRRSSDLPLLASAILDRIADARCQPRKQLSARAISALVRHDWPGNVRELENALSTATLFAEGDVVDAEDFTRHVKGLGYLASEPAAPRPASLTPCPTPGPTAPRTLRAAEIELERRPPAPDALVDAARACIKDRVPLGDMKDLIERKCLEHALAETRGNITRAAEMLGMKRSRVSQLVKEHGLRTAEGNAEETGS